MFFYLMPWHSSPWKGNYFQPLCKSNQHPVEAEMRSFHTGPLDGNRIVMLCVCLLKQLDITPPETNRRPPKIMVSNRNSSFPGVFHVPCYFSGVYTLSRWWFLIFSYFHPYLRKWSNFTNTFQMGWNHQPVMIYITIVHVEHICLDLFVFLETWPFRFVHAPKGEMIEDEAISTWWSAVCGKPSQPF